MEELRQIALDLLDELYEVERATIHEYGGDIAELDRCIAERRERILSIA